MVEVFLWVNVFMETGVLPLYSCTTDPNSVTVRWPDLTATEAEKYSLVLSPRRGEIGFDE